MNGEMVKALAAVQAELPDIPKNKTAKVPTKSGGEYSYKYADLSSISDKVLPLLAKNGLAWSACPTLDESGRFVLAYSLLHESGESINGSFPLNDTGRMQELGSAITYSRRYALCSVVGVVPDEDDDGHAASQPRQQRARSQKPEQPAAPPDLPQAAPPTAKQEVWADAQQRGWSATRLADEFLSWSRAGDTGAAGIQLKDATDEQLRQFLGDLRGAEAA